MAVKWGNFNESLGLFLRGINSKYWRTKKILAWYLYYPYEVYGNGTDLKW